MRSKRLWGWMAMLCIVIGAALCGAGIGLGGEFHDSYGVHFHTLDDGFGIGVLGDDEDAADQRIALQSFQRLEMDIDLGDVRIERGDALSLRIENVSDDQYELDYEGDTLNITSWTNNHLWVMNRDASFTLTIPKDMELHHIRIESDLGDVKVSGIYVDTLEIYQHMGDIKVLDVNAEDMTLVQDMGDIVYQGAHPGDIEAENHMGDIEVEIAAPAKEYAYDLSTAMGTIKAEGHRKSGASLSLQGGHRDASYRLILHNDMGDIDLEFDHD